MKKQLATSLLALSISTQVWAGQDNSCADLSDIQKMADCITFLQTKIQKQPAQIEALQKRFNRYEIVEGSFTWHEAKADAEKRGGHLATITSEAEWLIIKNIFGDALNQYRIWLGATDEETEGEWRWVTGEAWDYTRWVGGEPNNSGKKEHYLHILIDLDGQWNDLLVSDPFTKAYLLEK